MNRFIHNKGVERPFFYAQKGVASIASHLVLDVVILFGSVLHNVEIKEKTKSVGYYPQSPSETLENREPNKM